MNTTTTIDEDLVLARTAAKEISKLMEHLKHADDLVDFALVAPSLAKFILGTVEIAVKVQPTTMVPFAIDLAKSIMKISRGNDGRDDEPKYMSSACQMASAAREEMERAKEEVKLIRAGKPYTPTQPDSVERAQTSAAFYTAADLANGKIKAGAGQARSSSGEEVRALLGKNLGSLDEALKEIGERRLADGFPTRFRPKP